MNTMQVYMMAKILGVCILYSGKLSREKTFTNLAILEPPAKVFSLESFPLYGMLPVKLILPALHVLYR